MVLLNRNGKRVLDWIQTQGVLFCYESELNRMIRELTQELISIFGKVISDSGLCAVFTYRQSQQTEENAGKDGVCWVDVTTDIGTLYAIGISVEALEYDHDYSVLLFLHELAHIYRGGEHGRAFHDYLDRLISVYNVAAGSAIENDYFELEAAQKPQKKTFVLDGVSAREKRFAAPGRSEAVTKPRKEKT